MANRGKSTARKRDGIKDLAPSNTRGVKGGERKERVDHTGFLIVKLLDKATP